MGLHFTPNEHNLVIFRSPRALPHTKQVEQLLQNTLLQMNYPQSFMKDIHVISCDEICVIIQIATVNSLPINTTCLHESIGKFFYDAYRWDSVIILTTDEI